MTHTPTPETRKQVEAMAAFGIPQTQIGNVIGISKPTLEKHYRKELDQGATKANAKVAERLYNEALKGNTAALIFWCKTRMGWREKIDLNHGGQADNPVVHRIERKIVRPDNRDR